MTKNYTESKSIDLDFRNPSYLKAFIEMHKDEQFPLTGTNENGENVIVSAVDKSVDVAIYQNNGHIVHHTYWIDGEVEEWFE